MSEQYAFPFVGKGPKGENIYYSGMTLRDWFAGQALAGGAATEADAYQLAYAMMMERQK